VHPTFIVDQLQDTRTPDARKAMQKTLLWLLEALTRADVLYLETHPGTPGLYDPRILDVPGVRSLQYIPELKTENWLDVPAIMREGGGDCEDLSAFRCAEYRAQGIDANPFIRWRELPDGNFRFHALCRLPEGYQAIWPAWYRDANNDTRVEDPSANLGMYNYARLINGNFDPAESSAMFLARANAEADKGNTNAAATLRLRAQQVRSV
jgi:hypothetical protein